MAKLSLRFLVGLSDLSIVSGVLWGQDGFPHYCKTDAGVLGPYANKTVKAGEPCFGTKNGKRYEGVAVMSKGSDDGDDDSGGGTNGSGSKGSVSSGSEDMFPHYCKTDAGVLGPYPNSTVKSGEPCYGTKNGKRYDGVAVMSKNGN